MRVIIISRPKFPPPPEMMSPLMDAFADWRARYKPIMESFDFFVAGGGGCGIVNAPDDASLATMMMEYPWSPFSEVEVELLIDGDLALAQYRDFIRQQFGAPS